MPAIANRFAGFQCDAVELFVLSDLPPLIVAVGKDEAVAAGERQREHGLLGRGRERVAAAHIPHLSKVTRARIRPTSVTGSR